MQEESQIYAFCPIKNLKLKQERNISFEEIIAAIADGHLIDIVEHSNKEKYGNQKIYVISAKDYIYLVPFVNDKNGKIFLKTIIPSRKAKQIYFKREKNETKKT